MNIILQLGLTYLVREHSGDTAALIFFVSFEIIIILEAIHQSIRGKLK